MTKAEINSVAQSAKLKPCQVYKWIWDRKSAGQSLRELKKIEQLRCEAAQYHSILIGGLVAKVPEKLIAPFAVTAEKNNLSNYARKVLCDNIWQLVSTDSPENVVASTLKSMIE